MTEAKTEVKSLGKDGVKQDFCHRPVMLLILALKRCISGFQCRKPNTEIISGDSSQWLSFALQEISSLLCRGMPSSPRRLEGCLPGPEETLLSIC